MKDKLFTYTHKEGRGGFLIAEVSGWSKPAANDWYNLHFKNAGFHHSLTPEQFERFLPLWEALNG